VTDIRTEIRTAFEREQSAFPPSSALRAQVVAAVKVQAGVAAPARHRADRNYEWLVVAVAILLTIAIVTALMAARLMNFHPTLVKPGPSRQVCIQGPAPQPLHPLPLVHGYITFANAGEMWTLDPNHPSNRISLGPSNGMTPLMWSRDGSRLLLAGQFPLGQNWQKDLYVMNADGSQTRLTCDGLSPQGSFSPDGTRVVYMRQDDGLYVVDARGGSPRQIAKMPGFEAPAWSPDGSRIAFAFYREMSLAYAIWTMNPDGTDARQLVDLGDCGGGGGCTGGLAWSPDGKLLAFHSRRGPLGPNGLSPRVQAIYVVHSDGSGLRRINADGHDPSWSPDGSRIAFIRGGDTGVAPPYVNMARPAGFFTMAPNGSDVRPVKGYDPFS
jgi:Tol biopolymer transport system component